MTEVGASRSPLLGTTRARIAVALVAIAGALVWVAVSGLSNNLVYYRTPTEILRGGPSLSGQRIRLGGLVLPGTVRAAGSDVDFVVSDETTRMSVEASGGVPSLFRAGQGVVVVEAMKMENELKAPADGVVAKIHVEPRQTVDKGTVLITLE